MNSAKNLEWLELQALSIFLESKNKNETTKTRRVWRIDYEDFPRREKTWISIEKKKFDDWSWMETGFDYAVED